MAIDRTILESYKSGYSTYLNDMKARNITGKDYDEVERNYNRMIELAEECNDINDFSARLNAENVMGNMQAAYTRAILENTNKMANKPNAPKSQMTSGNVASNTAETVIGNVASVAQPFLYRVPGGQFLMPIANLFRWIPRLITQARDRRKNKKSDNGTTTTTTTTRVRRTS